MARSYMCHMHGPPTATSPRPHLCRRGSGRARHVGGNAGAVTRPTFRPTSSAISPAANINATPRPRPHEAPPVPPPRLHGPHPYRLTLPTTPHHTTCEVPRRLAQLLTPTHPRPHPGTRPLVPRLAHTATPIDRPHRRPPDRPSHLPRMQHPQTQPRPRLTPHTTRPAPPP